jgi:hypothetical protein
MQTHSHTRDLSTAYSGLRTFDALPGMGGWRITRACVGERVVTVSTCAVSLWGVMNETYWPLDMHTWVCCTSVSSTGRALCKSITEYWVCCRICLYHVLTV